MTQSVKEQIGTLPAIKAELHLVQVGRKMLCTDAMPRSNDTALQEAECVFDSVGVNVAVNVDTSLVFDGLVLLFELAHRGRICAIFVSHDHVNVFGDVVFDKRGEGSDFRIASVKEAKLSAALPDADDNLFCALSESWLALMAALLSANVSLVHFDSAAERREFNFAHCGADTMAEIPCGLVRTFVLAPKRPPQLVSRESFASFHDQQHGGKPNLERKVGIVEDRSRRYAELVLALFAVEQALRRRQRHRSAAASRTLDTVWPAQPLKQLAALVIGVKQIIEFN